MSHPIHRQRDHNRTTLLRLGKGSMGGGGMGASATVRGLVLAMGATLPLMLAGPAAADHGNGHGRGHAWGHEKHHHKKYHHDEDPVVIYGAPPPVVVVPPRPPAVVYAPPPVVYAPPPPVIYPPQPGVSIQMNIPLR